MNFSADGITMMHREKIEQAIAPFKWFHTISLGNGLSTPGRRSADYLARKLDLMRLPPDLSDNSVLDIGCNEGFFSIAAKRRGASRVLGIDHSQEVARRFALVREIVGHDVEFRHMGVYDLDKESTGTFDIVLFLSVFQHLRYPMLGLDRVASVTGRLAVMEMYVIEEGSRMDNAVLARAFGKTGGVRVIPNRQFLLESLERAGFARVEMLGITNRRHYPMAPAEAQRVILKAYK